ncbi:hypothetical protein Oter_1655 [Opitutus terrae PB90-1]|uniref:DUF4199 domain-containing protein n=2 Tax=Opitutus terrae TaxID=107709 RepID=B1ZUQ5_OPITP|nr:hypothetical protein Oter_1655 [Opitutus terrae PB90-1]
MVAGAMKTYVTYGVVWALAGALLNLALFFTGFHSSPEKLQTGQWIALAIGLVIGVTCLLLGTKARRQEVPATEAFGYGRALGAGVMIVLFATLFGTVLQYVYANMINPNLQEVAVQAQIAKWEAAGMSSSQMEAAEGMMRKMSHPALQAVFQIIGGMLFGTILALITSAFVKRPAAPLAEPPPAAAS